MKKPFTIFRGAPYPLPRLPRKCRKTTRPQWEGAEEDLDRDVTETMLARVPRLLAGGAR